MSGTPSPLHWDGEDLILQVRLQPRASADEIIGVHGDLLKVRVTAPPLEGQANAQLTALLARAFGVSKSRVVVERGASSREKRVRIARPSRIPAQLLHLDV